jgi:hypothetical protein
MGITKYFKILYHAKLVNNIFEAIQENLLTSSSTVKVRARIQLSLALQLIADTAQ